MSKIAVILFPGTNCEEETLRVVNAVGMEGDIVRWNTSDDISSYDGFILPGGFSYEDRIRAGIIAAKDKIMSKIKEEAKKGKPVLGICNGAQILIETSIVPGFKDRVQMALAPNINPRINGYYCTWCNIAGCTSKSNAFNLAMKKGEILQIPVAHGEGRFATNERHLIRDLLANDQIMFKYCDDTGNVIDKFPINPNGAMFNIAGILNKEGNVLAMMPHPERASWRMQIPTRNGCSFEELQQAAPARKIFESMKIYIEQYLGK